MPDVASHVSSPIGVFDSGVGGLTVMRALVRALPHEDFVYVGDTARLPYGGKPQSMVRGFAFEWTGELVARGVKAVVVACNTASAAALPDLAAAAPVPVWGVVEPGVATAVAAHAAHGPTAVVGVLGTAGTIGAGTYQRALAAHGLKAWGRACPLFVPIVEEGVSDGTIARLVAEHYLADRPSELRTLILGCTHYPPLATTLRAVLGPDVALVDSAAATAAAVAAALTELGLARSDGGGGVHHLVTGDLPSYAHVARVLDGPEGPIEPLALPLPVRPAWSTPSLVAAASATAVLR
ncbi:MAG: glutamate racemase [Trueperaceae bacterium]